MSDYGNGSYYPDSSSPSSPGLWLGLSIASTACCCLPFGIVGIVYAALALNARGRGSDWEVDSYTSKARGWTIASIVCGLISGLIYLGLQYSQTSSGTY